jgi:hypothetical protein
MNKNVVLPVYPYREDTIPGAHNLPDIKGKGRNKCFERPHGQSLLVKFANFSFWCPEIS